MLASWQSLENSGVWLFSLQREPCHMLDSARQTLSNHDHSNAPKIGPAVQQRLTRSTAPTTGGGYFTDKLPGIGTYHSQDSKSAAAEGNLCSLTRIQQPPRALSRIFERVDVKLRVARDDLGLNGCQLVWRWRRMDVKKRQLARVHIASGASRPMV
eukprot:scaffold46615_cov31-Tisochrysis_lutea.AAC.2